MLASALLRRWLPLLWCLLFLGNICLKLGADLSFFLPRGRHGSCQQMGERSMVELTNLWDASAFLVRHSSSSFLFFLNISPSDEISGKRMAAISIQSSPGQGDHKDNKANCWLTKCGRD